MCRRYGFQLRKHHRSIIARMLDEQKRIETISAIVIGDGADSVQFHQLRAIALVLAVDGAELIELADLPVTFARLIPRAILPDHESDAAAGIAETTSEVGLALAGRAARFLGQQREKVRVLAGSQLA